MREVVDAFGQRNHDCGGAVPLSWGRDYEERARREDDAYDLGDAFYQYKRVLKIKSSCAECRDEAEAAIARLEGVLG